MGQYQFEFGNAVQDGADRRGWLVGHFIPEGIRHSGEVEIKWAHHEAGEERESWQESEHRTTIVLLIRGKFEIKFQTDSRMLELEGDYAMWGAGIGHSWRAHEDSDVLTVRWPSIN